jgi:N utilization substance protein B
VGARRLARERALQALYQVEMTGTAPAEAIASAWSAEEESSDAEGRAFSEALVRGVGANQEEIDALIESHSHNWRLDRMSRIDRNILRLATYELKYEAEIPRRVTLNEAVELGKRFGTSESSAFINGLLDKVASTLDKP